MRKIACIVLGSTLAVGCASRHARPTTRPLASTRPADARLAMALDQIQPPVSLAAPAPTTRPSRPPIDAVQLYAQATAAQLEGARALQVELIRKAIELDPDSAVLHYELGRALAGSSLGNEPAIREFQRAAEIEPDDLEAHYELGRHCLNRNDFDNAIRHLRMAMLTTDYRRGRGNVAGVNLYLARALQQQGYAHAALEQYELLLRRMDGPINFRLTPELFHYSMRREQVYLQAADLCEQLGQYEQAVDYLGKAIARQPNVFAYSARLVRALMKLNRQKPARELAVQLVVDHRASPDSIDLLREVYAATGREDAAIQELRKLIAGRPGDRALVWALADALNARGQAAEAEKLLRDTLRESDYEPSIVVRLHQFYSARKDLPAAASLLVEALAHRPDAQEDLDPLWDKLQRGIHGRRLRLAELDAIPAHDDRAKASKLFWTSRLALSSNRVRLAIESLDKAVAIKPPFEPAYRQLAALCLARRDWKPEQRAAAVEKLIGIAKDSGDQALSTELVGRLMLAQENFDQAALSLGKAVELGQSAPSVAFLRAVALRRGGKTAEASTLLWEIADRHPTFEPTYLTLYNMAEEARDGRQAVQVVRRWLESNPFSVSAGLIQTRLLVSAGRRDDAQAALDRLFRDAPEDPMVLQAMTQLYASQNDTLLVKLEDELKSRPGNRPLGELLIALYVKQSKPAEAARVLETVRQALRDDPDELFAMVELFQQIAGAERTEEFLKEILQLDPKHPGTNNFLGYQWAEAGRNLAEAERMIRIALAAEPENSAYIDSLGWVLYKRSQFEEASRLLRDALARMEQPDAVVTDHLADALYRMGRKDEAAKLWQAAVQRLGNPLPDRDELVKLSQQLKRKLEEHKEGKPVSVAPIAGAVTQAAP